MNADRYQLDAINHLSGPALVIAGPGSGKTTVLTNRVKHLISTGVPPSEILVLTFSKAAANEMKERFLNLCKQSSTEAEFGTFHSVFYRFLKKYNHHISKIITEKEKLYLLKSIISKNHFDIPQTEEFLQILIRHISKIKSNSDCKSDDEFGQISGQIYPLYQEILKESSLMDFEDLLIETRDMLCENEEILKKIQNRFAYVFVDEFQDIDAVQYEILQLICDKHHNLFAVGDDDQCIYSFRGSNPHFMQRIKEDYPEISVYPLWNNYRCDKDITEKSLNLIGHNKERIHKDIVSMSSAKGTVVNKTFHSAKEEYGFLSDYLSTLPRNELNSTAILLRNNILSRECINSFNEKNIPFLVAGKKDTLADHPVVKDIFAYFRLCEGFFDKEDYIRVMNKPYRGLISLDLPEGTLSFARLKYHYRNKPYLIHALTAFEKQIQTLSGLDLFGRMIYLRKGMGYEDYVKRNYLSNERIALSNASGENLLNSLTDMSKEFEDLKEWESELCKLSGADKKTGPDGIRIMTMHASKGLEFDRVILPDLNEGIIPNGNSDKGPALEEERRLLYVAITRARHELIVLSIHHESQYKKTERISPSRFLKEI